MKGIVITKPIHANSFELRLLRTIRPVDHIDLKRCTFVCSEALEIIKNHPVANKLLSGEVVELLKQQEHGN